MTFLLNVRIIDDFVDVLQNECNLKIIEFRHPSQFFVSLFFVFSESAIWLTSFIDRFYDNFSATLQKKLTKITEWVKLIIFLRMQHFNWAFDFKV